MLEVRIVTPLLVSGWRIPGVLLRSSIFVRALLLLLWTCWLSPDDLRLCYRRYVSVHCSYEGRKAGRKDGRQAGRQPECNLVKLGFAGKVNARVPTQHRVSNLVRHT